MCFYEDKVGPRIVVREGGRIDCTIRSEYPNWNSGYDKHPVNCSLWRSITNVILMQEEVGVFMFPASINLPII